VYSCRSATSFQNLDRRRLLTPSFHSCLRSSIGRASDTSLFQEKARAKRSLAPFHFARLPKERGLTGFVSDMLTAKSGMRKGYRKVEGSIPFGGLGLWCSLVEHRCFGSIRPRFKTKPFLKKGFGTQKPIPEWERLGHVRIRVTPPF
jgi:hypothetical protein